jgi:uncharacterized protein (UPF0548 family)
MCTIILIVVAAILVSWWTVRQHCRTLKIIKEVENET